MLLASCSDDMTLKVRLQGRAVRPLVTPGAPCSVFSPSAPPAADHCVVSTLAASVDFSLCKVHVAGPGSEALFIGRGLSVEPPSIPEAFLPSKYYLDPTRPCLASEIRPG